MKSKMQESTTGGANLMTFTLPSEREIPPDTGCTHCGSSNLTTFEATSPTGVHAPDGTAESVWEEGVRCLDCGATASEAEPREWLAEAFQIVRGQSRLTAQREHLIAITLHFRELASALFEVPTPKEVN